jgi:hypothetical protein
MKECEDMLAEIFLTKDEGPPSEAKLKARVNFFQNLFESPEDVPFKTSSKWFQNFTQ